MASKTMTRVDILDAFSKKFLISQNKSSFLLEGILEEIFQGLSDEKSLKISSFGTFVVHQKKPRLGRNPKTGQQASISARKSLSFRGSQLLKEKINRKLRSPS